MWNEGEKKADYTVYSTAIYIERLHLRGDRQKRERWRRRETERKRKLREKIERDFLPLAWW